MNVEGTSFAVFFHQDGMRPQRIGTSSGAAIRPSHDVDGRRRGDVVVGPQIERRLRQPVKLDQFAPCVVLGEASAHGEPIVVTPKGPRRVDLGYLTVKSISVSEQHGLRFGGASFDR